MKIQYNISLKQYNTFGIDVNAERFVEITSVLALKTLLKTEKDLFIISGGSNMLLLSDIKKLVVFLNIEGIIIQETQENDVFVTANAGENWHDFVQWCITQNYGGLENLSLIPGNVGSCPIQNIGAYGVEVKDTIHQVTAIEVATGKTRIFTNQECNFGYRNSIFKNELKDAYIITTVAFKLTKTNHVIHDGYGAIQHALKENNIFSPSIADVSKAIIAIRSSKLPDPKEIGNSGSFFKNPVVNNAVFKKIQSDYADMPFYKVNDNEIKIPAGWLIETCGFKGKRYGDTGVHQNQALVLINYGNATGKEIYDLAQKIQAFVLKTFGIRLEIEVNVVN
ncbi:MAG: UDP-N-acetylenolpyruvoylglucosamine reductase [Flavobacteriaceae bacterium]|nr:MAG: UDP-N-acetylenolpyruvoylglucosamine reductase [Flavobacteriaceae bacterium]